MDNNKIEKLLEKHFTKLGCKCDVIDNTKQYQASLNAINEALTLYGIVGQSEQLKAVEELVDFARDVTNVCDLDRLEEILDRL